MTLNEKLDHIIELLDDAQAGAKAAHDHATAAELKRAAQRTQRAKDATTETALERIRNVELD